MSKNKVPVQKGAIVADQKTMKHMSRAEINAQDSADYKLKKDCMSLKLHSPKK